MTHRVARALGAITCCEALQTFVAGGGVLVVDMADNSPAGGFIAPGAQGTPDLNTPDQCINTTLTAAAKGPDSVPGTADDHPFVKGPDGTAGTADDLDDTKIDMESSYWVVHGNLAFGITLPGSAKVLTTAIFSGAEQPATAEYCINARRVILDTHTKEFPRHAPQGVGPSHYLSALLGYAMSPQGKCGFEFTGFTSPVDNLPAFNSIKAGSAVPLKFSLNGDQGMDILASGSPRSQPVACDASALEDQVEETQTAGGSSLSYDAEADQYVYVWKTDKAWAGKCRQLTVELSDGSVHGALFKLNR